MHRSYGEGLETDLYKRNRASPLPDKRYFRILNLAVFPLHKRNYNILIVLNGCFWWQRLQFYGPYPRV